MLAAAVSHINSPAALVSPLEKITSRANTGSCASQVAITSWTKASHAMLHYYFQTKDSLSIFASIN